MRVIRVELAKDKLQSIPEAEYTFFLELGHLANEINGLTMMGYWASQTPINNDAEEHGRFSMTLMLIQILAGKLKEGWELFSNKVFQHKTFQGFRASVRP